jgi:hypothetical protein
MNDTAYGGTLDLIRDLCGNPRETIEFFLLKKDKIYGSDTLKTREVYLGGSGH